MNISNMVLPDKTEVIKYIIQEEYIYVYTNIGKVYRTISLQNKN